MADKAVETSGFKALKIYFDAKRPETYTLRKLSDLFEDIRALIEQARAATARAINSAVTLLYW